MTDTKHRRTSGSNEEEAHKYDTALVRKLTLDLNGREARS